MYSERSQTMLRPDGAHLFVCRELAPTGFGEGGVQISFFLWRQLIGRFGYSGELQENSGKIVLRLIGQSRHSLNSLFKQTGHDCKYRASKPS